MDKVTLSELPVLEVDEELAYNILDMIETTQRPSKAGKVLLDFILEHFPDLASEFKQTYKYAEHWNELLSL